ncbi:MAG: hypothetical protein U1F76_27745 [Candidatus Competibacteraceae bacterium]
MTGKPDKTQSAALLLYQLKRLEQIRLEQGDQGLTPAMRLLKRWQSERLARTHADLLAKPRYRLAGDYFLSEIYGDKDFSRRDHDLERAYPIIIRTMPTGVLHTVAMAVELNALSWELDTQLLQVLQEEFGFTDSLDEATYASAYRECDNYDRRLHQVELIRILGQDLSQAVRNPFIYATLLLARGPAYLAGFGVLHDFIESGFRAFRHLGDPKEFLTTITSRERHILDRIYAAHPRPFALAD